MDRRLLPAILLSQNSFIGTDGYLHIVARKDAKDNYTSARMKTAGLQSFQYGRIEARIKMPTGRASGRLSGCLATTSTR